MATCLLVSGSPRKGNVDFVLSKIYNSLDGKKELVLLRDKKIKHCAGCLGCQEKPECIIDDDMAGIRKKMLKSDIIVIGTPRYFDNVSGLVKDFIDRSHPFFIPESLKGKKLILIMVGGGRVKSSEKHLQASMQGFVKYLKLDLVGSYCFTALHSNDLKDDPKCEKKINKIIKKIKSV